MNKTAILKGYKNGKVYILLEADTSKLAEFHEYRCMLIDKLKYEYDRFKTEIIPNELIGYSIVK